jgi:hypothetical protein
LARDNYSYQKNQKQLAKKKKKEEKQQKKQDKKNQQIQADIDHNSNADITEE